MIDWHCHILPGLDDGATDVEQSIAMATALAAAGYRTIYCTPHRMRGCYEAENALVHRSVADLQSALQAQNIPIALLPGCEYCLDEYFLASLDDPLPLGESRLLLIEIPPPLSEGMVKSLLYEVRRRGFTPVIAHPERCQLLQPQIEAAPGRTLLDSCRTLLTGRRDLGKGENPVVTIPPLLDYLREIGCSFQGNLGSFRGFYGRRAQSAALAFKDLGIYDRYGSDLHSAQQAALIFPAQNIS